MTSLYPGRELLCDRVTDEEMIDPIRGLAIPPAWAEAWVCVDPLGHLQARRP